MAGQHGKACVILRGWDEVVQNNLRRDLHATSNEKMLAVSKMAQIARMLYV